MKSPYQRATLSDQGSSYLSPPRYFYSFEDYRIIRSSSSVQIHILQPHPLGLVPELVRNKKYH